MANLSLAIKVWASLHRFVVRVSTLDYPERSYVKELDCDGRISFNELMKVTISEGKDVLEVRHPEIIQVRRDLDAELDQQRSPLHS